MVFGVVHVVAHELGQLRAQIPGGGNTWPPLLSVAKPLALASVAILLRSVSEGAESVAYQPAGPLSSMTKARPRAIHSSSAGTGTKPLVVASSS